MAKSRKSVLKSDEKLKKMPLPKEPALDSAPKVFADYRKKLTEAIKHNKAVESEIARRKQLQQARKDANKKKK